MEVWKTPNQEDHTVICQNTEDQSNDNGAGFNEFYLWCFILMNWCGTAISVQKHNSLGINDNIYCEENEVVKWVELILVTVKI